MRLTVKKTSDQLAKTDLLVVVGIEGSRAKLPKGVKVPSRALSDFKGEFREARLTDATAGPAARVLFVGLGKAGRGKIGIEAETFRRIGGVVATKAENIRSKSAALWIDGAVEKKGGDSEVVGRALAEGLVMGGYAYNAMKSKPTPAYLKSVALYGSGTAFRSGVKAGETLGNANAFTRDLQNAPGNHMKPKDLVREARALARKAPRITCRVHDEAAMGKMGMGSLLGVSRGSSEPAYLIHLTYKPKAKAKKKVAFVGKGLTFDAGGISIKPSAKMDEMKYDMSGGAAVLGAFHALCSMDVPFEVHGVVAASENLPDGMANKPGDVCTAMDGTTIEVLNTDAEGRLILADALCYTTAKIKPDTIIDLATLTGAVVVALGHELTGMFATTVKLRDALERAGEDCGEAVWPLPLLDCHREQMKGRVADLRNINSGQGNGSSAGAAFLRHFVGDTEWAHLDIAGAAWGALCRDYVGGPQGTGVGARLLMRYLENGA